MTDINLTLDTPVKKVPTAVVVVSGVWIYHRRKQAEKIETDLEQEDKDFPTDPEKKTNTEERQHDSTSKSNVAY